MGGPPFVDFLRERFGIEGETDQILAEKDDHYLEYAAGRTRPFPRVVELVRYLYVHGYRLAVGSASRRRVLVRMLEETGLMRYFDAAVGGDEVPQTKPAPDIFLEAARRVGADADSCLVVEDSRFGVEAARAAGMRVVALPASAADGDERFAHADFVVPGCAERVAVDDVTGVFALHPIEAADVDRFQSVVLEHHRSHRRSMPWRETSDPYRILVSEFMLQQTQVSRVLPRYEAFIRTFPDVRTLASATLQEVLSHWQGLGYNRRGKHLRDAAVAIVTRFGGEVPRTAEELRSLPGVGAYTSSAVAAFAFERRVVVIETNIRRLFLHYFFPGASEIHDRELEPVIRATLPDDVREWYYALMDYGSMLGRLFPNANRRSRHYARQSRFAGSVREVRGKVVRALSASGTLSVEELEREIGPTDSRFRLALRGLERDGMIEVAAGRVSLR